MEKFLIRKPKDSTQPVPPPQESQKNKRIRIELSELPSDPGLRNKISEYDPNQQDEITRAYLQRGPCQPRKHKFPQRHIGNVMRRFNPEWFNIYGGWLEYSIKEDAAYCLFCYLFKQDVGKQGGGESFVSTGFKAWNKIEGFKKHVGGTNSAHNQAWKKCSDLMKQDQHIYFAFNKQSDELKKEYRIKLLASIDCIRFLLRQGLAFRGHDESENSSNRGNFIELLNFLANHNEVINEVVVGRIQKNLKLTSPDIQKDIVSAAAIKTINVIIKELGDECFGILVDESRDLSRKEQMALALRYVDQRGFIIERVLGTAHVTETNALSLKSAIENLLSKFSLSLLRVRGQGYNGASNMRGEFNGLKSLIMNENPEAHYSHCFEKDMFDSVSNDLIMHRFQNMCNRRGHL